MIARTQWLLTANFRRGKNTVPSKTTSLTKNEVSRVWLSKFKKQNTWRCIKIKGPNHTYFRSTPYPVAKWRFPVGIPKPKKCKNSSRWRLESWGEKGGGRSHIHNNLENPQIVDPVELIVFFFVTFTIINWLKIFPIEAINRTYLHSSRPHFPANYISWSFPSVPPLKMTPSQVQQERKVTKGPSRKGIQPSFPTIFRLG